MDKYEKIKIAALKKMFSMVEQKYSADFCKKNGWFLKRSWTEQKQKKFKVWLVKELRTLSMTKRMAEVEAEWFICNYGWTTKEK